MQFKFFKGDLTQEPLKIIYADFKQSSEKRSAEIKAVIAKYPFNDGLISKSGWYCRMVSGIACKASRVCKVEGIKGFKVKPVSDGYFEVKPDKRYKVGRELAEDLKKIDAMYQRHRDFSYFVLSRLSMLYTVTDYYSTSTRPTAYLSAAGAYDGVLLVKMPTPIDEDSEPFPDVPSCLTEIKESEFFALQGK